MRDQALPHDVVLVEPEVRRFHGEGLEGLARRKPLQPWYEHLDDEAAVGLQMGRGILEAGDLLVLSRQIHDRVREEIGDREPSLHRCGGEVADSHTDLLRTRLRPQPRDHRVRQIDPVDTDASPSERQRDPTGADAKLERGTTACQIGEESDDRIDHGGLGFVRVAFVEALRHPLAEEVLGH